MSKKLFDFCIGNPPYQEDNEESVRKAPVYNLFMDAAYDIADVVELITPARFLFDAGQTPKSWNEKMLSDDNFSVLYYEKDASKIFSNTDIKGGVVISIRDENRKYGAIKQFTPYNELNKILKKINASNIISMSSIVSQRGMYRFSEDFYNDFPDARDKVGKGTGNMLVSNIFDKVPECFEDSPSNKEDFVAVFGRIKGKRVYKYIKRKYVIDVPFFGKWKLFFPEANGSGHFGEVLTLPELGAKDDCSTDTFINIGLFDTESEANALYKYIKTKFLRALLSVKKATQHSPKSVWEAIPLQNFSSASDIDWTKSIHEIDLQLYRKYNLSEEEIAFIETNVKEMA